MREYQGLIKKQTTMPDRIECKLIEDCIETILRRDPTISYRLAEAYAIHEITGYNVCEILDRSVFAEYKF